MGCWAEWESGVIESSQSLRQRRRLSSSKRREISFFIAGSRADGRRSFSIPVMINAKTAERIVHSLSHASLGARAHPQIAPRPLHDPMADHAIVLYDPTIDYRPSEEEIDAAKAELERAKQEQQARGPHKSLKVILGIQDVREKKEVRVPVVIDPRLSKTLRPHQIEGVKVGWNVPDQS